MVFLASFLLAGFISAHPLHVSLTSVEINTEQKSVTISHKFYTDDFSLLFFHLYEKDIRPAMDQEFTNAQLALINSYLARAFTLVSGKDTVDFQFVRKEQNEGSIWLYYTGTLPRGQHNRLFLTNILMLELYEDQTNLVIITNGTHEQGYTFNYRDRQWEMDNRKD
jgi:hypothetical protein